MSATSPPRVPAEAAARFDFHEVKWRVFEELEYVPDEWQALFHESRAKVRLLSCGTRVGKTHALVAECLAACVCPSPISRERGEWIGARVWVVAPTYNLTDKLFLPVARAIKRLYPWLIAPKGYSERERYVRFIGDGFLEGKSAENPDSLVGEQLDALFIDEAPRLGEFEKEQAAQRLATRDGYMVGAGSPVPSPWFQREFEMGQRHGYSYEFGPGTPEPGCEVTGRPVVFVSNVERHHGGAYSTDPDEAEAWSIKVPTHANHRIKLSRLARWERTQSSFIFRQDVLAEFIAAEGQVFHAFEHLMNAPLRTHGEPGRRYLVAWDIARTTDFSVLSVWDRDTRTQVFIERFQGPWPFQYERVEDVCRRFNYPYLIGDASGKGDPVLAGLEERNATSPRGPFCEYIERHETTHNAVKRFLVENLQTAIAESKLRFLHPDSCHAASVQKTEMQRFTYLQRETSGLIQYKAAVGFHDDTVMADALANLRLGEPEGTATVLFR